MRGGAYIREYRPADLVPRAGHFGAGRHGRQGLGGLIAEGGDLPLLLGRETHILAEKGLNQFPQQQRVPLGLLLLSEDRHDPCEVFPIEQPPLGLKRRDAGFQAAALGRGRQRQLTTQLDQLLARLGKVPVGQRVVPFGPELLELRLLCRLQAQVPVHFREARLPIGRLRLGLRFRFGLLLPGHAHHQQRRHKTAKHPSESFHRSVLRSQKPCCQNDATRPPQPTLEPLPRAHLNLSHNHTFRCRNINQLSGGQRK